MKNLQGLVSFVESAIGGSFTAAASRLDITPAAVGKNVMRLEQELQVRLFNRSTRRLRLTPEGEVFLEKAAEALRMLDGAVADITPDGAEPVGRVRISVGISFGRRFVLPLLPKLADRYPKLSVELSLDSRPVDLLAEGVDLAIRGGLMSDSSMVARRIGPLSSVLIASPDYLRRFGTPTIPADLATHRVMGLRFTSGKASLWRFREPGDTQIVEWEPHARLWTSDPESFIDLALAGDGICQAGLPYAAPHLRSGALKRVLPHHYEAGRRELMLCYPHRQPARRVRVVIDALMAAFASEPDLHLAVDSLSPNWDAG